MPNRRPAPRRLLDPRVSLLVAVLLSLPLHELIPHDHAAIEGAASAALSGPLAPIRAAFAAAISFVEGFAGAPPAPAPYRPTGWDLAVHSRDIPTWYTLEAMDAHHGPDCGAPPATHHLNGAYG